MSEPGRARRLFFALWPSNELRHDLEHETRYAARHSGGRVVQAANLHITLAFLGSVSESRLADAFACSGATAVQPFELILGEFVWWERQQLLCLEPTAGANELQALAARLHKGLRAKGFAIESRPFRAHLTLARDVRRDHALKPIRELHWLVERFELIESRPTEQGSIYEVLKAQKDFH